MLYPLSYGRKYLIIKDLFQSSESDSVLLTPIVTPDILEESGRPLATVGRVHSDPLSEGASPCPKPILPPALSRASLTPTSPSSRMTPGAGRKRSAASSTTSGRGKTRTAPWPATW